MDLIHMTSRWISSKYLKEVELSQKCAIVVQYENFYQEKNNA